MLGRMYSLQELHMIFRDTVHKIHIPRILKNTVQKAIVWSHDASEKQYKSFSRYWSGSKSTLSGYVYKGSPQQPDA